MAICQTMKCHCITKDKDGKLWVGTNDGIAIFNCPESLFSTQGCDAELKIVKYDLNAGLLFQREIVKTIAVDGANNKWIGTNNGVWLISDDAERIIHHFNKGQ
jgi:ligand-binding sensor domain-containing protein